MLAARRSSNALALGLSGLGCFTPSAPTVTSVPNERRTECTNACNDVEMRLSAIVVMANAVGYVCEPRDKPANAGGAAAAAGGMTVVMASQQQSHTPPPASR